jgi:hypothetical protein
MSRRSASAATRNLRSLSGEKTARSRLRQFVRIGAIHQGLPQQGFPELAEDIPIELNRSVGALDNFLPVLQLRCALLVRPSAPMPVPEIAG